LFTFSPLEHLFLKLIGSVLSCFALASTVYLTETTSQVMSYDLD
jgi:hypothetical protein